MLSSSCRLTTELRSRTGKTSPERGRGDRWMDTKGLNKTKSKWLERGRREGESSPSATRYFHLEEIIRIIRVRVSRIMANIVRKGEQNLSRHTTRQTTHKE